MWYRPRNCGCMHHPRTCVDKWRPTASMLCLLSLPRQESASGMSQLHSKQTQKDHIFREFYDYWWLFQMLHVSRYGTRLVEEERKKGENEQF